jgi:hypothetical protein
MRSTGANPASAKAGFGKETRADAVSDPKPTTTCLAVELLIARFKVSPEMAALLAHLAGLGPREVRE